MLKHALLAFALLTGITAPAFANDNGAPYVPEALEPWRDWVLHDQRQHLCPAAFDNTEENRCPWPDRLELTLGPAGGEFRQAWKILAAESLIPLPGDARHWPQDVQVNGQSAALEKHADSPYLRLGPGTYRLSGRFVWPKLPESLTIPPQTGLLSLSIGGQTIEFPQWELSGRLWLQQRREQRGQDENDIRVQVFRRIVDDIPLRLETRIALRISGKSREVLLAKVLPQGLIPLALDSPLPARLEKDGRLRLQVRPGDWNITVSGRSSAPVDAISLQPPEGPWAEDEIWVFDARNDLRLVELEGLPAIDPQQTSMPGEWMRFPAFRAKAGDQLVFIEKRRGDPDPAPDQLSLNRTVWLDFDGRGYTVRDRIHGTISRGWRLELPEPARLGRASVNGDEQFITRLTGDGPSGIEVRQGQIDMTADSRLDDARGRLPIVGWQQDFQRVSATLQLPPGWEVFAVSGADNVSQTWIQRWTLLDLFLVLIIALAVAKLWGNAWGVTAFVTLALTYHEPGAPRWIWLGILATVALHRALPPGGMRKLMGWARNLSLLGLAVIALPFMVDQIRQAIYPVLEFSYAELGAPEPPRAPPKVWQFGEAVQEAPVAAAPSPQMAEQKNMMAKKRPAKPKAKEGPKSLSLEPWTQYDVTTRIQTGPGVPDWRWKQVDLNWNGPVQKDAVLELTLLPPWVNGIVRVARVLLLAVLAAGMAGILAGRGGFRLPPWRGAAVLALLFLVLPVPRPALATEAAPSALPSPELLQELKQRLLQPRRCMAECAFSPRMRLDVGPRTIRLQQEIHAAALVSVPVPALSGGWSPEELLIDGVSAQAFRGDEGNLWVVLSPGVHQVAVHGTLPDHDNIQLPLPLVPHQAEIKASGWTVAGQKDGAGVEPQLELRRLAGTAEAAQPGPLTAGPLPPLVQVERTIILGLTWSVQTRIIRQGPTGTGILLSVPLIPGESVTSADAEIKDGAVQVNIGPQQAEAAWTSVLEATDTLLLTAPDRTEWTEVWSLEAAPIWHVEHEGIAAVHQQRSGQWGPQWRPWPGETVQLHISRPPGVQGNTLTIDRAVLSLTPGGDTVENRLELNLRSSRGGQHTLDLPGQAELQAVEINGAPQPIRAVDGKLTLPLVPGAQNAAITWHEPAGMGWLYRTPAMDTGTQGANAVITIQVPRNRWILLTGGETFGPAVLFWGTVVVLLLAAWGLGQTNLTPLKTRHWFLLGLGLSQVHIAVAIPVVLWLLALGLRCRAGEQTGALKHNLIQLALVLLTLAAMITLLFAIRQGLLGRPEMQVAGNGSHGYFLRWYQDRIDTGLPTGWVISVPLWVYRLLMLAWALWLAATLLTWLKWGWECFSRNGLWRRLRFPRLSAIFKRPAVNSSSPERGEQP